MVAAENLIDKRRLLALAVQFAGLSPALPVDDARFPDVVEHVAQKLMRILLSARLKVPGQLLEMTEDLLRSYHIARIRVGMSNVLRQFAGHAQADHLAAVQMIFVRDQQVVHKRWAVG